MSLRQNTLFKSLNELNKSNNTDALKLIPSNEVDKIMERLPDSHYKAEKQKRKMSSLLQHVKNNIKVIVNVYQPEYYDSKKATGFGDFIRGTYFVMQFSNLVNVSCNISINHPFKKYLKFHKNTKLSNSDDIRFFDNPNFHPNDQTNPDHKTDVVYEFCNYLKEQSLKNNIACVYAISFPFDPITDSMKKFMKKFLEPTEEFKNEIFCELSNLKLEFKKYIVIHIRSGDNFLIDNGDIDVIYLKKIVDEINSVYKPGYPVLLISDSVKLKQKLVGLFPNISASFNEITHSGEGEKLEDEKIKNTLLDFFLMAFSVRIFSYSCYDHGTGFSRWCAITFNSPYSCKFVK
jgi:hypothetical protein